MGFYDTSIVVAGVVLALFLGIIAYMMHTSTNTLAYPPVIAECPDYWKKGVNEDGEEVYYKIKNKMYNAIISDTLTENYPDINYIINVKIDDVLQKIQVKSAL